MQYKSVKGFTGMGQLGILLVFLGLGLVLASVFVRIVAMKVIPESLPLEIMDNALKKALLQPQNVGYARLTQVMFTFFMFFVPALLYTWVINGRDKFWLGFNSSLNAYQVLIGFVIIFVANIVASPLEDLSKVIIAHFPSINTIAKELEKAYNEQVVALSNLKSWPEFIMAIFIMAFFPALFEEVFFRGAVQNLLVKWWKAPLLAIIVTSLLFSLIHMSVYLFLSRAVLGFVLGLLYQKTRNIWVNVIAHFLNNTIAVTQLFVISNQKQKMDIGKLDPKVPLWIGFVALVFLFFLFRLLNKYSFRNREKINAQEQLMLAKENVYAPFANTENN